MRASWAEVKSQYDAFLAANLHPEVPIDRQVMLTRFRVWVVNRGYSQELNVDSLLSFSRDENGVVCWQFDIPVGMGCTIPMVAQLQMVEGENKIFLKFKRLGCSESFNVDDCLGDEKDVQLIVRPDIENRNCHEKTKAFIGPEKRFPESIQVKKSGFIFTGNPGLKLDVESSKGDFVQESEWKYMLHHPFEEQRGLESNSDLFSPGYFSFSLTADDEVLVTAAIKPDKPGRLMKKSSADNSSQLCLSILKHAISDFIVQRDEHTTVIAGYPWFLDWGRDTLICLRGIISAGFIEEAKDILVQFAKFEKGGTIPNMIRGEDDSNRDTSDAPLWLCVASRELYEHDPSILEVKCDNRTLKQVLIDLEYGYHILLPK